MMMWFLFLLYIAHSEPVISQGSPGGENRLVLKGERPCEGHIEIYHNGVVGYVGHTYWNDNIEKVVCRSAHCGEPKPSESIFRPANKTVWLDDINCNGNETHLWECDFPGWGVFPNHGKYVKKITCSSKVEMSLDGPLCAGAVQYVHSEGKGYFCADKIWGLAEANVVCESLGCGSAKVASYNEWTRGKDFEQSQKATIDCSGITDYKNLWQCVTTVSTSQCENPVSVTCAGHERLQLRREANSSNACRGYLEKEENSRWIPVTNASYDEPACHQMHCGGSSNYTETDQGLLLTCKNNVSVVLMDQNKPSSCYGAVHVEVNKQSRPVCASTWTATDGQVVCRELNCGNVVIFRSPRQNVQGIMENVKCSGRESSLWHCGAKRDKDTNFQCSKIAFVACSESVNVRLMDGPGQCAGRVEIHYGGQWWRIEKGQEWTKTNSDTVCKQLNCGEVRSASDRFSQGSGEFLPLTVDCKQGAKNISECTMKESSGRGGRGFQGEEPEAVSITCEKHKVVFLEGTCSGKVGIEQGGKSYWLSGNDSNTWDRNTANTVCRQMHCGNASDWNSVSSANLDIWTNVYNCPPNSESLFRCKATKLPSDHNETSIATVTCEASLTMNLTNGCWGSVNVCMGGKCGGLVCRDSWTDEKYKMLCKELGCGDEILLAYKKPGKTNAIFKSLHTTKHTKNLTQCNFVKNNETERTCEPAYVICSGSATSQFDGFNSRSECSGNVEVFYEGSFLPVCSNVLTNPIQNTICQELRCGQAVKKLDYFGPKSGRTLAISQIECPENAKSLTACKVSRTETSCALGGLQCSKWRKVELNFGKKACSGDVFVESKEGRLAVPADRQTDETGRTLCKDLNCGDFVKFHNSSGLYPFWDMTFSCRDGEKPENIWKCKKAWQSSARQLLSVECQDPNVTLSGECHGEVRINNTCVCSSSWNDDYSNKLCKEKSCGSIALFHETGNQKDTMYHVSYDQCDRLGECNRYKKTCTKGPLSVYCVRNVEFNTTEKCGGQIQIIYRDKPEKVCAFPDAFRAKLCRALDCGGFDDEFMRSVMREKKQKEKAKKSKESLQKTVQCSPEYKDYKYCIKSEPCEKIPAEIYCTGYDFKPNSPTSTSSSATVPVIVGIGLILVLVILIAVFVRVYIVRRARRAKMAMNASSRMYSRKEVEFESGDYEDVSNKANEMEDFSHGNFRQDTEVFMETDTRSNTSLPYDDIDEAVETQPLTSPASTKAVASVDSYFQDGTPNQSTDGVTYEVDDPQENYDDIEPDPEVTETKAEVHASPETTPESVPAAPPGRVQGDEDYLVPGQDG